jgi:adenosylhomocysteine nucleosidase
MSRIAFVAALEREVSPLIRNWKVRTVDHGGRQFKLFENGDAVLVCGGIGAEAARRATEAVIQQTQPVRVISVGFAGALDGGLKIADVFEPRTVIHCGDGSRTDTGTGQGILVSFSEVADKRQKGKLGKSYGAKAVDMEAAAVAQGAQARGVQFGALKAISDETGFAMPAMERFIASDGRFLAAKFAVHVAVRPWLWATTIALARNSTRASGALCGAIESYCKQGKRQN